MYRVVQPLLFVQRGLKCLATELEFANGFALRKMTFIKTVQARRCAGAGEQINGYTSKKSQPHKGPELLFMFDLYQCFFGRHFLQVQCI